jgi:hypothetical protein
MVLLCYAMVILIRMSILEEGSKIDVATVLYYYYLITFTTGYVDAVVRVSQCQCHLASPFCGPLWIGNVHVPLFLLYSQFPPNSSVLLPAAPKQ